jgi:two-component system sensor histidine kinase AlgZ
MSTVARVPVTAHLTDPNTLPDELCQGGVVLRTVLFVHGVAALGLCFRAGSLRQWLVDVSVVVAAVLPATLVWLLLACALGRAGLRSRASLGVQGGVMGGLGAGCGALAWGLLVLLGQLDEGMPGAFATVTSGTALAAAVFHWQHQRTRLRLPMGTQARLAELQSRIRPHFLFNALNSAIALVRVDPAQAEAVLEDLSELFRAALVGSGEQVTLGEEVELAQRYLAIEQVRFGERLTVRWKIDAQAAGARVPSLLLQPLVENAVKHGVEPSAHGGDIRIRAQARRGHALITITNTVPPDARPRKGHGMALHNVRERLQLLHDLDMRFEAGLIEGGRFRVRLLVPLSLPLSLSPGREAKG